MVSKVRELQHGGEDRIGEVPPTHRNLEARIETPEVPLA